MSALTTSPWRHFGTLESLNVVPDGPLMSAVLGGLLEEDDSYVGAPDITNEIDEPMWADSTGKTLAVVRPSVNSAIRDIEIAAFPGITPETASLLEQALEQSSRPVNLQDWATGLAADVSDVGD